MTFFTKPSSGDHASILMDPRREAEDWLRAQGTGQWSDREAVARDLAKWRKPIGEGRTWVILDESGDIVATVRLSFVDRACWSTEDAAETALHLYKLIVRRSAADHDIGSLALDWACRVGAVEGQHWIRIGCWVPPARSSATTRISASPMS
ncbi:GNAT family N-acetyltransferase [Streptomyces alboniger]|uniref:N-acetyltransferase domain-containing protein n=1 Tax=Streptomyces alboniger TaxID=132473 RepID=A0A5J6HQT6_STRAD|nr:GNAT family N-acetyltransferase [Streptomyces alboniger]QEV21918.1 hypothetical protein CP975_34350 [Streptomyces alboniger]